MKKKGMKRIGLALVSGMLILSEMFSFAGCRRKTQGTENIQDGVKTVSKDSTWFNATTTVIDDIYKDKGLDYYDSEIVGMDNGNLVMKVQGFFFNENTSFYEDFINIDYYDINGKLVRSEKGTIDSSSEVEGSLLTWVIGEYTVDICFDSKVSIRRNGQQKDVDLASAFPSADIAHISGYITVSEKEILLVCLSNDLKFISLNLESGEAGIKDKEYSWLKVDYTTRISSFGGKSYFSDSNGIKCIDFAKKEAVEILSFNDCNLNRYMLSKLSLLQVDGDKYYLAGMVGLDNSRDEFSDGRREYPTLLILEKAETNPNAGKKILTITASGRADMTMTYPICEAIRIFNDTNADYFIQIGKIYDLMDYVDYSQADDDDEFMNIYYRGASDLNTQLAADLLSGDRPDIILNAGNVRQIQSEDYLMDLTTYMGGENGIHTEDYFSNVIDAAKAEGKLLYMPLSFTVEGISADKEDVREGQIGFTFDEYTGYVSEKCNGSDPMADTRLGVLCTLFSYISDTCIGGGKVDFDNASFRQLCEYVKDHVDDHAHGSDGTDWYPCFGAFLQGSSYLASKKTLLGYPSKDGRGTLITVDSSIGISAFAPATVADGAWEFIKLCLGEDIQSLIESNYSNPMSQRVFDADAEKTLENYNRSEMALGIPLEKDVIVSYKHVLLSASVLYSEDPDVLNVIREEIPPYLFNQKSLEEVLAILKNRVSLIMAERARS